MSRFESLRRSFTSWKQSRKNQSQRKLHGQDHRARLRGIESLEDRFVLTTYLVDTTDDVVAADTFTSLREAIQASNTNLAVNEAPAGDAVGGDLIRFSNALAGQTITLDLGQFTITDELFINGQNRDITIDADNSDRIFNVTTGDDVRFKNFTLTNGEKGSGGAIRASGGGNLRLDGMDVNNSEALGNGGNGGGGALLNIDKDVRIYTSTFSENDATGTSGSGGAIQSRGGSVVIVDTDITGNSAVRAGGGIEVTGGSVRLVNGSSLNGNSASASPGNGGGLHVTAGGNVDTLIIDSEVIGNTAASEGGGLWNAADGTMTVLSSTVQGNTASGDDATNGGGGIFNDGGKLTVKATTIDSNIADGISGSGGGILSTDGIVRVRNNTAITNNTATRAGGGVEVIDGDFRIFDTLLSGNVAGPNAGNDDDDDDDDDGGNNGITNPANPGNGGALHVSGMNTVVVVRDSMVNDNWARNEGGGLWNQSGSTMFVRDTSLDGNIARGKTGGGAIFDNGGTLRVLDSLFTENKAVNDDGDGGAIFLRQGGDAEVETSRFEENEADERGGAIFNDALLTVINSRFDDNDADDGDDIFEGPNGTTIFVGNNGDVEFDDD